MKKDSQNKLSFFIGWKTKLWAKYVFLRMILQGLHIFII